MKAVVTTQFKKSIKHLTSNDKKILDDQIRRILKDPTIGDAKKGDLSGVYTVGFKLHGGNYRIAYEYSDVIVILLYFGSRENFYRDLKSK